MKSAASILGTPRRMFLAVVTLLVLLLASQLIDPSRKGVREHKIDGDSIFGKAFQGNSFSLETNRLYWWGSRTTGQGMLGTEALTPGIEFALCTRKRLVEVTPEDVKVEFAGDNVRGTKIFGRRWGQNCLCIPNGEILLIRNRNDTQTVYALQAVEQRDNTGYFRSRKILPAPAGK